MSHPIPVRSPTGTTAWEDRGGERARVGKEPILVSTTVDRLDRVLTLALAGAIDAPWRTPRQFLGLVDLVYEIVYQMPDPQRSALIALWDDSMPELRGRY